MSILVKNRYRPFTTKKETSFLLPGTSFFVKSSPSKIEIYNLEGLLHEEILFELTGPIEDFLVIQDLEKGQLRGRGKAQEGFYEWKITAQAFLLSRWTGKEPLLCSVNGVTASLSLKNMLPLNFFKTLPNNPLPFSPLHFSLGVNKSQDVSAIYKRNSLEELLPFIYKLSTFYPEQEKNTFSLLQEIEGIKEKKEHHLLGKAFLKAFQAYFSFFLVPDLKDKGEGFKNLEKEGDPLSLLSCFGTLIFSLFFKEEKNTLFLLPHLPSELSSGRWVNVPCFKGKGLISIEWTKKNLRRITLLVKKGGNITLSLGSSLKEGRMKKRGGHNKSERVSFPYSLDVQAGEEYFFDCFQG